MSAVEMAAEQVVNWYRDGMKARECLQAMGRSPAGGTWAEVFRAVATLARQMGAP